MKKLLPLLSVLFLISVGFSQNKVNINNLVQYGDKWFRENDDRPFSGIVFDISKETGVKVLECRYFKKLPSFLIKRRENANTRPKFYQCG